MLLAGCAARPATAWQPEQAEAVAWWIEDVAHRQVREPGELDLVAAGPRMAEVALWAAGSVSGGQWTPPGRLAARQARWPEVAAALGAGEAVVVAERGLLAPSPTVTQERRVAVTDLVDAENDDRRFLTAVVLAIGKPDPRVEGAYAAAVVEARRRLDQAPPAGR